MQLTQFNQILSDKGWNYADLALLLADLYPLENFHPAEVREAVRRWCGKDTKRVPSGKTMKIVRVASIIAGRPLSESVSWIFKESWTHQRKPSPPTMSRRTARRKLEAAA